VQEFHEARLVKITHGRLAIWLEPIGMLNPEVVVNLLPKLGVGVDFVRHGHWLGKPGRWEAESPKAAATSKKGLYADKPSSHLAFASPIAASSSRNAVSVSPMKKQVRP
jgi:hypothetical protein